MAVEKETLTHLWSWGKKEKFKSWSPTKNNGSSLSKAPTEVTFDWAAVHLRGGLVLPSRFHLCTGKCRWLYLSIVFACLFPCLTYTCILNNNRGVLQVPSQLTLLSPSAFALWKSLVLSASSPLASCSKSARHMIGFVLVWHYIHIGLGSGLKSKANVMHNLNQINPHVLCSFSIDVLEQKES